MTSPLRKLAFAALLSVALSGCAASAHFYSKNGQSFAPLTEQAVYCDEGEIGAVTAAGGFAIGVVDAKALMVNATDNDLAAKAAKIAARNGGTHVLRTEKGIETFTVVNPARRQKNCVVGDGTVDCQTTYTPATTSTFNKPTAKFVVFLVPPQSWGKLPPPLRPQMMD